jgi:hypothetical protein
MADPLGGGPGLNPDYYAQKNAQQRQAWTAQQIEYAREIAAQLNKSASDTSPIYSPWAGAARMADALMGGLTARRALEMERQNQAAMAPFADQTGGSSGAASEAGASSDTSASSAPSADLSYGAGVVPMDAARAAIAGNEQDARGYGTIGQPIDNPNSRYYGDQAVGKYQWMSRDLPQHLANAGMPPMNVADFLKNGQAQETLFEREFGPLMQQHGFNDAASIWFSGRPMAQAGNSSDGNISVPQYVTKANQTLARLGIRPTAPGAAAPAQVPSQGATAPAAPPSNNGAMNFAAEASPNFNPLAGTQGSPQTSPLGAPATQPAATPNASPGASVSQGAPQGGLTPLSPQQMVETGQFLDPRIMPIRPPAPYSLAQLQRAVAGGQMDPATAAQWVQKIYEAHQPMEMPYGGGTVRWDPRNPGMQTYMPQIQYKPMKVGDVETQAPYYVDSKGVQHSLPSAGTGASPSGPSQGGINEPMPQSGNPSDLAAWSARRQVALANEKMAGEKEAERENKEYSGWQGEASIHNQMKPFIQIGLSVLNNANLWTGPLNEQAQAVKQALVNAGMMPADGSTPMEVFKKTMAQAMVTKMNLLKSQGSEAGETASRIFLPMVQQMQDSSPTADNSVAGNRYLLNTMNHERDRANLRADLADQWRSSHGGSMLGFDKELRDQERNNPTFQAQPDELFVGGHAPAAQAPNQPQLGVGQSQPFSGGTLRRVK